MCCNHFSDQLRKRTKDKRGTLRLQGSRERDELIFIWPGTISMDGFVCRKQRSRPGYTYKGGFLQFARKKQKQGLIENEIASLRSIKTQFGLLVTFSIIRDNATILEPFFLSKRLPSIFNKNNKATIEDAFIRFIDEVKGKIEEWSQKRGSGWVRCSVWKCSLTSLYTNHFEEDATCHCQKAAK